MNREELLNSLTQLAFMAVAADTVRAKYEEIFGPLCSFRSYASDTQNWQWKNNPWPWQSEFNYSLAGKECK